MVAVFIGNNPDGGGNLFLTIDGGTFKEKFVLASAGTHTGNIDATINGGEFLAGIYAYDLTKATPCSRTA